MVSMLVKYCGKLIGSKNGMEVFRKTSKLSNGAIQRTTTSFQVGNIYSPIASNRAGKAYKQVTQVVQKPDWFCREMVTEVRNFNNGNYAHFHDLVTPNRMQKFVESHTFDKFSNRLLERKINCDRTGGIANNGKPCDFVISNITRYNPANQDINITCRQFIDRTKIDLSARPKLGSQIISNGWVTPPPQSNFRWDTSVEALELATGIKVSKLGYI